jgi:hypothetical protein
MTSALCQSITYKVDTAHNRLNRYSLLSPLVRKTLTIRHSFVSYGFIGTLATRGCCALAGGSCIRLTADLLREDWPVACHGF